MRKYSGWQIDSIFLTLPRKLNFVQIRQFAWFVKFYFLGKSKKYFNMYTEVFTQHAKH